MTWDDQFGQLTVAAAQLHAGQIRKQGGMPYLIHPLQVVQRICSWGIDRYAHGETWKAALFHDAIEDTEATSDSLLPLIGASATRLVVALTFDPAVQTKEAYLAGFQDQHRTPTEAVVVKLADRFCNVEDFLRIDPSYARIYFWKAAAVYQAFEARKKEITSTFGREVVAAMQCDLENLTTVVGPAA
ncbi:HD domain-containing protein [Bremerella cremea]|uniref:HD domain-containing protein n=1 Tax=Bremerella cremea TaxID=1031537 RepID=A0A368KS12_9BACT|nr:HD domain-containing protein [Bremerella cremea]RCS44757.1 HD domain-containing protein [Bremerella cremea]